MARDGRIWAFVRFGAAVRMLACSNCGAGLLWFDRHLASSASSRAASVHQPAARLMIWELG